MKFKYVLFSLIGVLFILALVSTAGASENDTGVVNDTPDNVLTPQIDISQDYEPEIVNKGDIVNVYVHVTNYGNETIHDLIIFYHIPKEFELLIYPAEYEDGMFVIDSLVPGQSLTFTFVCRALESNVTGTFEASLDGNSTIPLDIYVQPEEPQNNQSNSSDVNNQSNKINNSAVVDSNSTGNPFVLLIFGLLIIPLSMYIKR